MGVPPPHSTPYNTPYTHLTHLTNTAGAPTAGVTATPGGSSDPL